MEQVKEKVAAEKAARTESEANGNNNNNSGSDGGVGGIGGVGGVGGGGDETPPSVEVANAEAAFDIEQLVGVSMR
jgi:hypothetical protein